MSNTAFTAGVVLLITAAVGSVVYFNETQNLMVPAGCAAYVMQRPIFGKAEFIGVYKGPTSTGRGWRYDGQILSVTPYTNSEQFNASEAALAKDKLPISLNAHIVWKIKSDEPSIRSFMEEFGGLDENASPDQVAKMAYEQFIREPYRTICRSLIARHNGLEINDNLETISKELDRLTRESLAKTPFEVISCVIGKANPPEAVITEIALKVAKTQELERKATELEIANKDREIQKAKGEAQGEMELAIATKKAEAMAITNAAITPALIQWQAVLNLQGAQRIYLPVGPNGLPVTGTVSLETPAK